MGAYEVIGTWRASDGDYPLETLRKSFDTLDEAEGEGQKWGCMAGISKVEVHGPEGLEALWDKDSTVERQAKTPYWVDEKTGEERFDIIREASLWQSVGEESKRLRSILNEATMQAMRDGLSTSQAADRLRAMRPIDSSLKVGE